MDVVRNRGKFDRLATRTSQSQKVYRIVGIGSCLRHTLAGSRGTRIIIDISGRLGIRITLTAEALYFKSARFPAVFAGQHRIRER